MPEPLLRYKLKLCELKKISVGRETAALIFLMAGMLFLLATFPYAKVLSWPVSTVVTDKDGVSLRGALSQNEEWAIPVPLAEMGKWMPRVVVALEDKRYYAHCGVDIMALLRAAAQNRMADETVSGASTVTSQVIRLSIERKRTVPNKCIEFWQAMQLEYILTKDGILELYLNRAPFGGNIRGVGAAALAWFNKPAKDLSLAEAAMLAGMLRGPSYYRPDKHPERALALRDRLLDTLAERGAATRDEVMRAKREPLPNARFSIPSAFRQATEQVVKQSGVLLERDRFGRVRSTIDRDMQNLLLSELISALSPLPPTVTASAVLVENGGGAVRGYIGNAREGMPTDASWVDCASSPRSPGSALKPFIYALAFESGGLTPSTMIPDSPLSMKGAAPRNYDRHYRGPVTVRTALADSLNIPAVRTLHIEGGRRTIDLYRRLGFSHFTKDADWYGDSLALGGCEVTPLELAEAYRTLADGGISTPLKWTEGASQTKGERVISRAACALVLDILKDTRRLLPLYSELFGEDGTVIAFKTGTSYGLRDAWTAAVTKKYTLIVWFGDPNGRPHPQLIGLKTAAPVAVRVMRKLSPIGTKWFDLPEGVGKRKVCALSGAPENPLCPASVSDLYIKNISSNEPCALHISENGHTAVRWPPELEGFFSIGGTEKAAMEIEIISPRRNAVYDLSGGRERLPLIAEGGVGRLFWFADGELIEDGNSDSPFWKMTEGRHRISVTDEDGSGAEATIAVRKKAAEAKGDEGLPLLEEE